MINIPIEISIPQIWGDQTFSKNEWGTVNILVGPNGTGKSLLAEEIKNKIKAHGIPSRLLNAERLSGLERRQYSQFSGSNFNDGFNISQFRALKKQGDTFGLSSSAFVILKERLDIRIRIEAMLSDIFGKTIRFVEEGGFLKPKIQNINGGTEYALKEEECHGLKELITLLTFLYDDQFKCLVFDEPELHLHPQFQSFFLNEIRKVAGDPMQDARKKLIVLVTHSPYFLELRTIDDLRNVLVCHYGIPPTFVEGLDDQDEYVLKRFLPRFNTHHKQFFFSPNPIFVEGYTDQQIISLLFDKLDWNLSSSGSCIIDVGGKDELAVFFRLCKKLGLRSRIIADLDAFFKGKLREAAQLDARSIEYVQQQGLGADVSQLIGELEAKLKRVADDIATKVSDDADLGPLIEYTARNAAIPDERIHVITALIMAMHRFPEKIHGVVAVHLQPIVNFLVPRFEHICDAFRKADIYFLPKGTLESYYVRSAIDYLNLTNKDAAFHTERDYILETDDKAEFFENYSDLLALLRDAVPPMKVNLDKHLKFQLVEWIQGVQVAIAKGGMTDIDVLKANAKIRYELFSQIFDLTEFNIDENLQFQAKLTVRESLTPSGEEIEVSFNETTIPHNFDFKF